MKKQNKIKSSVRIIVAKRKLPKTVRKPKISRRIVATNRRPRNETRDTVLEAFAKWQKKKERFTSVQLANALGFEPAYIRATLARAGIALPRSKRGPSKCGIMK